jgi:hypothetical protein
MFEATHQHDVVSDSNLLTLAPQIAGHFVQAEVRHFGYSQKEETLAWLRETIASSD